MRPTGSGSRFAALACALAAALAAPAVAHADIAVERLAAAPVDPAAGAHSRFDLHAEFSTGDPLHDLTVHLPPGLVGNPRAVPRCPQQRFASGECPAETRVGSAKVVTTLPFAGTASGAVYNLEPSPGEPARLGVSVSSALLPAEATKLVATVALRPDGGLTATVADIPADRGAVRSIDLSLGDASAPGFMTNPTSCGPATTTVDARAASGARGTASATFTPTRCEALAFAPSLTATLERRGPARARDKPALRATLVRPANQAAIRRVAVTLPPRLGLDLTALGAACTVEQAQADACPAASRVGTVQARTALLATPLAGPIFLTQRPGTLMPGLRLALGGPVQLRLDGATELATGLTTAFDGLPDLPVDRIALTFAAGGPLKLLGDPCRGARLRMGVALTGHTGATAGAPALVRIGNCPAAIGVRLSRGARPRLAVRARRGRDAAKLWRIVIRLPEGMRGVRSPGRTRLGLVVVRRHTVTVRLRRARPAIDLRLPAGMLKGRPRGPFRVTVTAGGGKRTAVRLAARKLR